MNTPKAVSLATSAIDRYLVVVVLLKSFIGFLGGRGDDYPNGFQPRAPI